jgi:hypothetical protein
MPSRKWKIFKVKKAPSNEMPFFKTAIKLLHEHVQLGIGIRANTVGIRHHRPRYRSIPGTGLDLIIISGTAENGVFNDDRHSSIPTFKKLYEGN